MYNLQFDTANLALPVSHTNDSFLQIQRTRHLARQLGDLYPPVFVLSNHVDSLKIPNQCNRVSATLHKIPSSSQVSIQERATPKSHAQPTDPIKTRHGKNKRSGTCVCKSDGSTNLSGRLRLGHGHWGSHVPRRREGEAPRHGRCATAINPRRIKKIWRQGLPNRPRIARGRSIRGELPAGNFLARRDLVLLGG